MIKKIAKFKRRHKILFALLVGFSVVSFWRGAWGILDVYLFPDDYHLSSIASLAIGLSLLALTDYLVKELT